MKGGHQINNPSNLRGTAAPQGFVRLLGDVTWLQPKGVDIVLWFSKVVSCLFHRRISLQQLNRRLFRFLQLPWLDRPPRLFLWRRCHGHMGMLGGCLHGRGCGSSFNSELLELLETVSKVGLGCVALGHYTSAPVAWPRIKHCAADGLRESWEMASCLCCDDGACRGATRSRDSDVFYRVLTSFWYLALLVHWSVRGWESLSRIVTSRDMLWSGAFSGGWGSCGVQHLLARSHRQGQRQKCYCQSSKVEECHGAVGWYENAASAGECHYQDLHHEGRQAARS